MAEGNRLPSLENAPHLKTDGEFFRKPTRPSLPLKKAFFESLRLPLAKGSSTFLTKPLFPQGREDVTALRCSEPLRYKVGGPSKVSPYYAGWDRLNCSSLQYRSTLVAARMRNILDCDSSSYATFIGLKYSTTQQEYKRVKKNS